MTLRGFPPLKKLSVTVSPTLELYIGKGLMPLLLGKGSYGFIPHVPPRRIFIILERAYSPFLTASCTLEFYVC